MLSACAIRATTATGSCFEVAAGHAHRAHPVREQHLVSLAVALERESMTVGVPAVELHRQPLSGQYASTR